MGDVYQLHVFKDSKTKRPPGPSEQQLATENLIRILRNTMNLRAKVLLTSTESPVYDYFKHKQPRYRVLKGGRTGLFPVYTVQGGFWGLIHVQSFQAIDRNKAGRILQAIEELLKPSINKGQRPIHVCDGMNVFLNCHVPADRIKIALEILDQTSKSCMLYWEALAPSPTRVSELYDLSDTLIFIKEVLSLKPEQRKLIALYMNLPDELKGAQLVISSSYGFSEIKKLLHDEPLFLDTLERYRFDVTEAFNSSAKEAFFQRLSQTLLNTTTYSHLY